MSPQKEIQLYDLSQLQQMVQNEEALKNMINIFVTSTPAILANLNDGYACGDTNKIAANAHQLKPSFDMLGIHSLHAVIRLIDKPDKVDRLTEAELRSVVNEINNVIRKVFDQLYEEFGSA